MKKPSRTLLTLGAIAVLGYGGLRAIRGSGDHDASVDPGVFENRAWLERAPEKPTETVHVLFALSHQAAGVFFEGSSFVGRFERFEYERKGGEIRAVFPQTSKRVRINYKVTSCHEKEGFDLCLDLDANPWGGPKRYYSSTDQDSMPSAARDLAAAVEKK